MASSVIFVYNLNNFTDTKKSTGLLPANSSVKDCVELDRVMCLQMLGQTVAACVLCLASLLALTAQDLPPGGHKRAELLQDSFLPDQQFSSKYRTLSH